MLSSPALIDLHCHILPALDDGAADLGDSVAMARQAELDGIDVVCATPHIRHDHDVVVHELEDRTEALNAELSRQGIRVRVSPAGEVAETALGGLSDDDLRRVSLDGGGRWLLLEPGPGPLSGSLEGTVGRLLERGCRSVVAHPERHLSEDFDERLAELVRRGALVQLTAALLEDAEAAPGVARLVREGLVHLLGSDAHSSRFGRPLRLSGAVAALREEGVAEGHLEWITRVAPRAILRGEGVQAPVVPS